MSEQWECIYAYSTFLRESLKVIDSLILRSAMMFRLFYFKGGNLLGTFTAENYQRRQSPF